jgi:hypothetical protein
MRSNITLFKFTLLTVVCILLSLISIHAAFSENTNISMSSNSKNLSDVNRSRIDLVQDPFFRLIGKDINLTSYWRDSHNSCLSLFSCHLNLTDGWDDNQSFQLSTENSTRKNWSWISSNEIKVKPNEIYEILGHIKLSEWATQSHIVLEGFNESSRQWYQIIQCPPGINGPLEWKELVCKVIVPPDTSTISLVLNAGWSSQQNQKATTLFDAIHIYKVS